MTTAPVRRALLRILIAAVSVTALVLAAALVSGDLDDTDAKIIATSLLFAVVSTTAAAGFALRVRREPWARPLGLVSAGASAGAFVLVTIGMWGEIERDGFWLPVTAVCVVAVETAHASFVLASRRAGDPPAAVVIARIALVAGAISGTGALLAIAGWVEDPGDGVVELYGVVLVVQLLCTILPPLLRRLHGGDRDRPVLAALDPDERLAAAVLDATRRIELLATDPRVRAGCERLRELVVKGP